MPHIIEKTTLEDIRATEPDTIWYSVNTRWWTHRLTDLRERPDSRLPCDPRGGMLMMVDAEAFLSPAEANPAHYGKHGLAAFMAAHNDNCVVSPSDSRSTCLRSWQEYNDLLDQHRNTNSWWLGRQLSEAEAGIANIRRTKRAESKGVTMSLGDASKVVLWPGGDEPISDDSIEVRAGMMAAEAIEQGATKVWVVQRSYWDHSPSDFTPEEVKAIIDQPEPLAFADSLGNVHIRVVGIGPFIDPAFVRLFEQTTG